MPQYSPTFPLQAGVEVLRRPGQPLLISFDDSWKPRVVMAEAPHGTAPALFGKNELLGFFLVRPKVRGRSLGFNLI